MVTPEFRPPPLLQLQLTMMLAAVVVMVLVMMQQSVDAASLRIAHGSRRSGRRLTGVTPILTRSIASRLQCLSLCGREPSCRSLQLIRDSSSSPSSSSGQLQCQLLAQTACDGPSLVDDPAVHYFDVYNETTREVDLPLWEDESCRVGGLCAAGCLATAVGQPCRKDIHCSLLRPPGAYVCVGDVCALSDAFWLVRSDLVLPRWTNWTVSPLYPGFKQLMPGTCTLNLRVRLGKGGRVLLAAVVEDFSKDQDRHMLAMSAGKTQLLQYSGSSVTTVKEALTKGMLSDDPSVWSPLVFSWCGNQLSVGSRPGEVLFSQAMAPSSPPPVFLMSTAEHAECYLQVDRYAADPWLMADLTGVSADPIFDIAPSSLVTRFIDPTDDVTVKYDCQASRDCCVYFGDDNRLQLFGVTVGGWGNSICALQVYVSGEGTSSYELSDQASPVLDENAFITFKVRYQAGKVTVWRGDPPELIYDVVSPHPMGDIISISVGSMWHEGSRKRIRLARYDDAWRTDSWPTDGVGFSNMALP